MASDAAAFVTRPFADAALAARLEAIAARDLVVFAETAARLYPDLGVDTMCVDGGVALWLEPGSPLNVAVGLGLRGPVDDDDLVAVESFFEGHGGRSSVAICPLADASLTAVLAQRGYALGGFENVLTLSLGDSELPLPDGRVEVREVNNDLRDSWARTVAVGFSTSGEVTPAEERLAQVIAHRENSRRFLAFLDGVAVGTGELALTDGVGWLSADAVLPAYRGRGVQTALQLVRLHAARADGCDVAVCEATPGSGSQRNMERRGFVVAYTRVEVVR